jgi:hypothetical protein
MDLVLKECIRKGRKRKDSLVRGRNRWGGAAIEWWVW